MARCVAADPTRRKCHNDESGYISQRNHPVCDGAHTVLYHAGKAGLDAAGGRYVVVCEVHGTLCNTPSRDVAYDLLAWPEFCEPCMARDLAAYRAQRAALDAQVGPYGDGLRGHP